MYSPSVFMPIKLSPLENITFYFNLVSLKAILVSLVEPVVYLFQSLNYFRIREIDTLGSLSPFFIVT